MAQFVLNMVKIFMPNQDEEIVIQNLYEVIELCRKKKQDLNNEQALALTLEKLKQPKKRRSRKINNNLQQVSRVIQ